jgi:predicted transcriptional regulator
VNKVTTTIRIEESIHKTLQIIADKEVRSVNNLMEYALMKFVEEYKKKVSNNVSRE